MRRWIPIAVLLAVIGPQLAKANYCGKIERGISPWDASRGPGDAYWEQLEALQEIGLLVSDYSATDGECDDHPLLEEGGAFFAVRTPARRVNGRRRYEQDRDALWAVAIPHMYQLVIPFALSAAGQFRHVCSHDGRRVYDLSKAVGPEGGFTLDLHGRNAKVLRRGNPEHTAFFAYVRSIRDLTKRWVPDSERERLDVDVDRDRISPTLRVLFLVLRLLSSASIIAGNLDETGRSWQWSWGRYARVGAEGSYRGEELANLAPLPDPGETRGDKPVRSRRQEYRNFKLWYRATKRGEELEAERQRDASNPNWHMDYFLRQCVVLAHRQPGREPRVTGGAQYFYAPAGDVHPTPKSTSGSHASLSGTSRRSAALSQEGQVQAYWAPTATVIARSRATKQSREHGIATLPSGARNDTARRDGLDAHDYNHDVAEANAEAAQTIRDTVGE